MPESHLESERDEQLQAVIAEYIRSSEAGRPLVRQDLLHKYSEFAAELKQFFVQRDQMNRLADPIRAFKDDLFQAVGPGRQLSYVGNYELLEEVARGGMGVVYKARQTTLGRIVAVKMIVSGQLANEQDVQRFKSEAQAAASLHHPSIVPIHEVGQHEGWHYFSMDYVEGHDLAAKLRLNLPPARTAAAYVRQMAEAIHYAHQQGILHRDLKPSNILVDVTNQIHITDFGLAMRVEGDQGLTQTGQILGTPSYMPPEQAQCKRALIGPASDVYSLGAILYECLTGRPPFRAESVIKTIEQVIHADAASPRTLNSTVPRDLETICLKCLEKEPHRRYGTAQLLQEDLGRFLSGEPIVARPALALERTAKWIRRHPMPAAFIASSMVALLAVTGMGLGLYYNAQLDEANNKLRIIIKQQEETKQTLESSNQQLSVTSEKLEHSIQEVNAERGLARRNLYASRMALVQVAERDGQTARIVQLLRSVIPESKQQEDLRDFEWNYLWRKYHGEHAQLSHSKSAVRCLALSPDGQWLAAAGDQDPTIIIYDVETGQNHRVLSGHSDGITDIKFNNDGQRLVSASQDGTIKVWELASNKEQFTLRGHNGAVTAVAYGPDETQIYSADLAGTLITWDAKSGASLNESTHASGIDGLATLKKVDSLLIGLVYEWRIQPLVEPASKAPPKSQGASTNLAVDSTGQWLAFGFVNKDRKSSFVHIWDVLSDEAIWTESMPSVVESVTINSDGNMLAAAWDDQSVVVWEMHQKEPICTYHAGDTVRSLAFAPDGSRLFAGTEGGNILIWSIPGKEVRTVVSGQRAYWVAFIDDDRLISPGGKIWGTRSDRKLAAIEPRAKSLPRWKTSKHSGLVLGPSRNELVDVATGQAVTTLQNVSQPGPFSQISQFAFGNEDKLAAGAFGASSVDLWDASTGELLRRFDVQPMAASVALSPDGKLLAAGTAWKSAAPGAKDKLFANQKIESCVLTVWDTNTGRQVFHRTEKFAGGIWDLAFSPDGSHLAAAMGRYADQGTSSGRIKLWNSSNWRQEHEFRGHTGSVWSVAFNASGTRIVSSSGFWMKGSGQVKVWDVETGLELLTIADDNDPVFGIAFSPDGHRLATANGNGLVRLWNGEPLIEAPDYQELPLE